MSTHSMVKGSLAVMLGTVLLAGCGGTTTEPATQQLLGSTRQAAASTTPYAVSATNLGSSVVSVAGGSLHSLAVKSDGTVWGWGNNNFFGAGPLGTGNNTSSNVPVQATGISTATKVSARLLTSAALLSNGTVYTWGYNGSGQLGDGTTTSSTTPAQVTSVSNVTDISVGFNWMLALKSDGTLRSWGENGGKHGDGTFATSTAIATPSISSVVAISAGNQHGLAVKSNGTVWVWGGSNMNDYMGTGGSPSSSYYSPTQVLGLSSITAVAAGSNMSLALDSSGNVWAWGNNGSGQLGDGTTTFHSTPAKVKLNSTTYLSNIQSIGIGRDQCFALDTSGNMYTWGSNSSGQIGDGTTTDRLYATSVLSNVLFMGGGDTHTLAVTNSSSSATAGAAYAWGGDGYGQLGNGP